MQVETGDKKRAGGDALSPAGLDEELYKDQSIRPHEFVMVSIYFNFFIPKTPARLIAAL